MSKSLKPNLNRLVDGENNAVVADAIYSVSGADLLATIDAVYDIHGSDVNWLPLSACSCGGGVLQSAPANESTVIGLHLAPTQHPLIKRETLSDICGLPLDEIVIDETNHTVSAGAAITLDQLNRSLAERLDARFQVLGADLTSYQYAQVGSTFMTGGMGPQRRYFSDSVQGIALFDGDLIKSVSGDQLRALAGTYGWSGLVTAVSCQIHQLPANEIAFALPVSNTPAMLATLLDRLAPLCYLDVSTSPVSSMHASGDLIMGIEHVTATSMQPFLESGNNELTAHAAHLRDICARAHADGLVFVTARSHRSVDDFLQQLIDNVDSEPLRIGGVDLEFAEVFPDLERMRAIREGIPFAARTQMPRGEYLYKTHTDATIHLNSARVADAMSRLWQANCVYTDALQDYFDSHEQVRGEVLVYGHLNPSGVDPHNRVTFASDSQSAFEQCREFVDARMADFYRDLKVLCEQTESVFVGGEKSAASEAEILEAISVEAAPGFLQKKFEDNRRAVSQSQRCFNWRAPALYRANR